MLTLLALSGIICIVGALSGGGNYNGFSFPELSSWKLRLPLGAFGALLLLIAIGAFGRDSGWWGKSITPGDQRAAPKIPSGGDAKPNAETIEKPPPKVAPAQKPHLDRHSNAAKATEQKPTMPRISPESSGTPINIENNAPNQGIQGCATGATCTQPQIYNAPKPYSVSPTQVIAITDFLSKQGRTKGTVTIGYEDSTPGANEASEALRVAFTNAGLTARVHHAAIYSACAPPGGHGLFFDCYRENDPLAEALVRAPAFRRPALRVALLAL